MLQETPSSTLTSSFANTLRGKLSEKWYEIARESHEEQERKRKEEYNDARFHETSFLINELCNYIDELEARITSLEPSDKQKIDEGL